MSEALAVIEAPAEAPAEVPVEVPAEMEVPAGAPEGEGDASEDLLEAIEAAGEEGGQTFSLKVDGEEQEISLEALKAAYGKDKASGKRFEEAATMRKEAEGAIAAYQELEGEVQAISHSLQHGTVEEKAEGMARMMGGHDHFVEFVSELNTLADSYTNMSETERRVYEQDKQLVAFERAEARRYEHAQAVGLDKETHRYHTEFTEGFVKALEAEGARVTPRRIQQMANLAQYYVSNEIPMDTRAIARAVKAESSISNQLGADMEGEDLLNELGPDVIKKVERAFVKRYKKTNPTPVAVKSARKRAGQNRALTSKEWFALPMDER